MHATVNRDAAMLTSRREEGGMSYWLCKAVKMLSVPGIKRLFYDNLACTSQSVYVHVHEAILNLSFEILNLHHSYKYVI